MSVNHPRQITCACGTSFSALLADSVNAGRVPAARRAILDGTFHRVSCPRCNREFTVERPFFYTDFGRGTFIKVMPRRDRHRSRAASESLDRAASRVPVALTSDRRLRVVFGMNELREKLVAEDAGLDDRMVELMKVFVIADHPFLVKRPRLQLVLHAVDQQQLEFAAAYDHDRRRFRIKVPRWIADSLLSRRAELVSWAKGNDRADGVFAEDGGNHWISIGRLSSEPAALAKLREYAAAIAAGESVDTTDRQFEQMLAGLPSGNQLPPTAKQDLSVLFQYARRKNLPQLQDRLFELRFGFGLEDDWSTNSDPNDIDVLWRLLKDLPDTNVEGNTFIRELLLEPGGSYYEPSTYDIAIGEGELSDLEGFEDVVRHEVGHAVHEQNAPLIDGWLANRFGWRTFAADQAGVDQWVGLMGGWGDLTELQRAQVRNYLVQALGPGSRWSPGPAPNPPAGHPWWRPDFGPRLAFAQTTDYWYLHHGDWYRVGTRAFFMNFWYRTFVVVDTATLDLVGQMPSHYAAMSHFEFFAELYALYYDVDDPKRGNVPRDVADWLDQNIGTSEPNAPAPPARPAARARKQEFERIRRPRRK